MRRHFDSDSVCLPPLCSIRRSVDCSLDRRTKFIMPGGAKKFHTRHHFGRKRRRGKVRAKDPASSQTAVHGASPGHATDAGGSSAPALQCDNAFATHAGDARLDSALVTEEEVRGAHAREQKVLRQLGSTPATARKIENFSRRSGAETVATEPAAPYTIVELDAVNDLILQTMRCHICRGKVKLTRGDREYGLAVKLHAVCDNCGDIGDAWSSRRVKHSVRSRPFAINMLAGRAMLSTGNGQTAMNDIFSAMGLSSRAMHKKTFQRHLKNKLEPAATRAAEDAMQQCAREVSSLYEDLCFGHRGNIAVCFDGSWMTRGHSSHIGVGAVIELFTGYVLDYVVLSNFCLGCDVGLKPGSEGYEQWKDAHRCQKNTSCKSGQMEVEEGLILFERSLERRNLRYTTVLCDGDSRTYNAIRDAKVYGFIDVEKEDCTYHVQKRMGTALRNLVQKQKTEGRSLGGKGRLTADLITRLSTYYGRALKSHQGNVDEMQRAVMATYHHITSTDESSNHSLCPTGEQSWCRHNAAKAKGMHEPKHKYNLPKEVAEALLPVYERLSDRSLLQRCLRGKTQNSNESLHSVIWSLISKEQHSSLFAVQAAVAEAVLRFNAGNKHSAASILQELGMNATNTGKMRTAEKDKRRSAMSTKRHAASEGLKKNVAKKHKDSMHPDYAPGSF